MDKFTKAIVAALVAGYAIYEFATTGQSAGGESVVANEYVRIVVSSLIAGLSVWAVPNTKDEL